MRAFAAERICARGQRYRAPCSASCTVARRSFAADLLVRFDDDALLLRPILDDAPRSLFYFPALGLRSVREFNFRTFWIDALPPKARLQRSTFSARAPVGDARPHRSRACVARQFLLRKRPQGSVARQSSDTSPRCQGQGAGRDVSHEIVTHRDSRHARLQS